MKTTRIPFLLPALFMAGSLLIYLYIWEPWDNKRQFSEVITIKCKYKFVECANQEMYFYVINIDNEKFAFLQNKLVGLMYSDSTNVGSILLSDDFEKKEFEIIGKLYKRKAFNEIYDCDVGAYRFEVMKIKKIR